MKKIIAVLALLVSMVTSAQEISQPVQWLMPKPKKVTENGKTFDLQRPVKLTDPTASALLSSLFTTSEQGTATVVVNLVSDEALGTFDYALADFDNEGYRLNITTDNITITAASKTGVIRAAQTLIQLAAATDGTYLQ